LALHFPRLRIIWSSSPHESVKILSDLKLNHDEPDEETAILKGSSDGGDMLKPQVENAGAVEMLRAIPGISGHNYRHVMAHVDTIRELVDLDQEALKRILGEDNGAMAYRFLHRDGRQW
jgi:DNA excision repair protein ERCC-4